MPFCGRTQAYHPADFLAGNPIYIAIYGVFHQLTNIHRRDGGRLYEDLITCLQIPLKPPQPHRHGEGPVPETIPGGSGTPAELPKLAHIIAVGRFLCLCDGISTAVALTANAKLKKAVQRSHRWGSPASRPLEACNQASLPQRVHVVLWYILGL